MKVKDIVKMSDKYDFGKHVVVKYVPYAQKMTIAKSIADTASYKVLEDGTKVYCRDTNLLLFLFSMKMLEAYTDIEVEKGKEPEAFDELTKSGKMKLIMKHVPEDEIVMLRTMVDNAREDLEMNTRSIVSFLETKTEAFSLALDSLGSVLESPEIQEKLKLVSK